MSRSKIEGAHCTIAHSILPFIVLSTKITQTLKLVFVIKSILSTLNDYTLKGVHEECLRLFHNRLLKTHLNLQRIWSKNAKGLVSVNTF